MLILKFSSIIEHADFLSDLMSCPCFVLSSLSGPFGQALAAVG